jgi:hypothetical protein
MILLTDLRLLGVATLIVLHALAFRLSVYQKAIEMDRSGVPVRAKAAAILSMILWLGMAICGQGIGYIESPLDKIHAQAMPTSTPPSVGVVLAGS